MNPEKKYRVRKPSKGERLQWSPLKKGETVRVTEDMLQSHLISEKEIYARQRLLGHLSLLVP
jgi:hypothetical protein